MTPENPLPAVPEEPKSAQIPLFQSNNASLFNKGLLISKFSSLSISTCASNSSQANYAYHYELLRRSSFLGRVKPQNQICDCVDVLIADDDAFQHLYYRTFFQRSLGFNDNVHPSIKLCFSGEELIEYLLKTSHCGCGKLTLVVLDYFMGKDKLCGVDTALRVRSLGYQGPIVLRTSETVEYLKKRHLNIDELVKAKLIDVLVQKDNFKYMKEEIQRYLT